MIKLNCENPVLLTRNDGDRNPRGCLSSNRAFKSRVEQKWKGKPSLKAVMKSEGKSGYSKCTPLVLVPIVKDKKVFLGQCL